MSPFEGIHGLSATEAARRVAARELSALDLVDAAFARAAEVDPELHVFALTLHEAARDAARKAEAELESGRPLGALHGVPITVKDNIAMAGLPMRQGSATPALMPAVDAVAVQRIKRAGAIVIGKTTLPEMAHKVLTDNRVDGVSRNPWNLGFTPGGSSGGAAAGVASGITALALGTDGGGSIRCPASCTSTLGLKATLGRIPNESAPDGFGSFFFVGPIARTAEDLRLLLQVLQGPCHDDPFAMASEPAPGPSVLRGLRIGWVEHFGHYQTAPDVSTVANRAMLRLGALGAHIVPNRPRCFEGVYEDYRVLATTAHATRFGHLIRQAPGLMTDSFRESIETGFRWSAVQLLQAQDRRTALFRAVQALFEHVDVIATPTLTAPPLPIDAGGSIASDAFGEWAAPLYPFNMTGHPALSVPIGFTAEGLPIGLQLVGRWSAERLLVSIAADLEVDLDLPSAPPLPRRV